jgi:hypothetical protein
MFSLACSTEHLILNSRHIHNNFIEETAKLHEEYELKKSCLKRNFRNLD